MGESGAIILERAQLALDNPFLSGNGARADDRENDLSKELRGQFPVGPDLRSQRAQESLVLPDKPETAAQDEGQLRFHIQFRARSQKSVGGPADQGFGKGQQNFSLVAEVEVNGARGDARAGGDLFDGRPLVAAVGEDSSGGFQNMLATTLHFLRLGHTTPLNERSFKLYIFRPGCQVQMLRSSKLLLDKTNALV